MSNALLKSISALDNIAVKSPVIIPCILNIARGISYEGEEVEEPCTVTVLQKCIENNTTTYRPVTVSIEGSMDVWHIDDEVLAACKSGDAGRRFHLWRADGLHYETKEQEESHQAVFCLLYGFAKEPSIGSYWLFSEWKDQEENSLLDYGSLIDTELCTNLCMYQLDNVDLVYKYFHSDFSVDLAQVCAMELLVDPAKDPVMSKLLKIIDAIKS